MLTSLPSDLVDFLRSNSSLAYDVEASTTGPIELVGLSDLHVNTLDVPADTQGPIADPFADIGLFDATYQIRAVNLIALSEHYDPDGLLCWLPDIRQYAAIDAEHGLVLTFGDATWTDIASDPQPYLDAQWDPGSKGTPLLTWLHYPGRLGDTDVIVQPYGQAYPLHQVPLSRGRLAVPPELVTLRAAFPHSWAEHWIDTFPCCGVPVSEDESVYCPRCVEAQEVWIRQADAADEPVEVRLFMPGCFRCPRCDKVVRVNNTQTFQDGMHLPCRQRVRVIEASEQG